MLYTLCMLYLCLHVILSRLVLWLPPKSPKTLNCHLIVSKWECGCKWWFVSKGSGSYDKLKQKYIC